MLASRRPKVASRHPKLASRHPKLAARYLEAFFDIWASRFQLRALGVGLLFLDIWGSFGGHLEANLEEYAGIWRFSEGTWRLPGAILRLSGSF